MLGNDDVGRVKGSIGMEIYGYEDHSEKCEVGISWWNTSAIHG